MYIIPELQLIRAGLDSLTIRGADAKFMAQLQEKIEQQLTTLALASPQDQQDKTKKYVVVKYIILLAERKWAYTWHKCMYPTAIKNNLYYAELEENHYLW